MSVDSKRCGCSSALRLCDGRVPCSLACFLLLVVYSPDVKIWAVTLLDGEKCAVKVRTGGLAWGGCGWGCWEVAAVCSPPVSIPIKLPWSPWLVAWLICCWLGGWTCLAWPNPCSGRGATLNWDVCPNFCSDSKLCALVGGCKFLCCWSCRGRDAVYWFVESLVGCCDWLAIGADPCCLQFRPPGCCCCCCCCEITGCLFCSGFSKNPDSWIICFIDGEACRRQLMSRCGDTGTSSRILLEVS